MSGSKLIYQYEKYLKKIIKRIRKGKEDSKAYIEYEKMINKLKKYKKYKGKDDMKTTLVIMAAGNRFPIRRRNQTTCSSWFKWRNYHGLFYP